MMTLYETHIVFLLSFIFPNSICAFPGSISTKMDGLNVDGALFNTHPDPINFFPIDDYYRDLPNKPQQKYFALKTISPKQLGYLKRLWPYLRTRSSGPFSTEIDYYSWNDDSLSDIPTDVDYLYSNEEPPTVIPSPYQDSAPYWIRNREDKSSDLGGHFEGAIPETLTFRKRQSALSPPARDWCRMMGFQVCPREN